MNKRLDEAEVRGLPQLVVSLYTGDTTLDEAREIIAAVTRLGDSWLAQRDALRTIAHGPGTNSEHREGARAALAAAGETENPGFDEPPGSGADPFGRPDPRTHPEFWTE